MGQEFSAKLLLSAVGRRRYVVDALLSAKPPACDLILADADPQAIALQYPQLTTITPPSGADRNEWVATLIESAQGMGVTAILSLHDFEGALLAQALAGEHQPLFIGPSSRTAEVTLDKALLAAHSEQVGGSVPRTFTTLPQSWAGVGAWVVKDRWGSASSGLFRAPKLSDAVAHIRSHRQGQDWVLQPAINGEEYNVDLFFDRRGDLRGHCVKRKLAMRGGETDRAEVLVSPPDQVLTAAREIMSHLRVCGNVDIDVILADDGQAYVIDVNPRFGGGFAFSALAGYQAADGIWSLLTTGTVAHYLVPQTGGYFGKYIQPLRYNL